MITVEATGALALVQDLGRAGLSSLGVGPSGAADRGAHRQANRLVGNPDDAATVEALLGGLQITTDTGTWAAVTGPDVQLRLDGTPVGSHRTLRLEAGARLVLPALDRGLRSYLAVRGGVAVEPVLGSRSTDLLTGIGPAPLRPGDRLPVGTTRRPLPAADWSPPVRPEDRLLLTVGPRTDWFHPDALPLLLAATWTVSPDSDRTASRLTGPVLRRAGDEVRPAELPSEGLIRGAVQVPTSGQPLVFGADHPVTGGYPVIAVLTEAAADAAAQVRPGDRVCFRMRSER